MTDTEQHLPARRIAFAGYSDDIVWFTDGMTKGGDERYPKAGDLLRLALPDGPTLLIGAEFGRDGWEFSMEIPAGATFEYVAVDGDDDE